MSTTAKNAKEIFLQVVDLPADQRPALLDQLCGQYEELRRDVEALLQAHEAPDRLLDQPDRTAHHAPPTERPGQAVGPYKLLQQIGEGGMGVVYMAEQTSPVRRRVAVKIIKPGMDSKEVVARFEAERQALALMEHTNIAKVYDGGVTATGRPYFVMELVRGVPLTEFSDANKLETQERLKLFIHVCHAIQHAHHKGVIHRDVKPSNILVTLHDGVPAVKVIDFGVSKALNQPLTEKTLFTAFGQMVGTPQYMSPEQAELSGIDVDTRSDVYSLGVLLYELLVGTTPLDPRAIREKAYAEVQRMIREFDPPPPSTRLSTLGRAATVVAANRRERPEKLGTLLRGELDWIVMKCLEKDRNRRYETANALAADVERHLNQEPVEACPPSWTYRAAKIARRNKGAAAALGAVVASLAIGLAIATIGWGNAWKARNEATKAREEISGLLDERTKELKQKERRLYAADVAEAYYAWNNGAVSWAADLVRRYERSDLRTWEWHYLSRQLGMHGASFVAQTNGLDIRISPDQQYVAVVYQLRNVFSLLERQSGTTLHVVGDESQPWIYNFAEFSADSQRIVYATNSKRDLVVCDVPACSTIAKYEHNCEIAHAMFRSSDPQSDVVFLDAEGKVFLFDVGDQKEQSTSIQVPTVSERACIRAMPDGRRFVVGGISEIYLIDLENMKFDSAGGQDGRINDIEILEPHGLFSTCSSDGTVCLRNIETGEVEKELAHFDDEARAQAYHPELRVLAVAGRDRRIRRWRIDDLSQLPVMRGFSATTALEYSSDGVLYYLSQDFTLAKHTPSMDAMFDEVHEVGEVRDACFSGDGNYLVLLLGAAHAETSVQVYRQRLGKLMLEHEEDLTFTVTALEAIDESTVVLGDEDSGTLARYSLPEFNLLNQSTAKANAGITSLAYSSHGNKIAAGLANGGILVVGADDLEKVFEQQAYHQQAVHVVAWCEPANAIVSASPDGRVALTGAEGERTELIHAFRGPINSLAVVDDRILVNVFYSTDMEKSIIEIDLEGNEIRKSAPFALHADGIAKLRSENTLVAASSDGTLRFMDSEDLSTRVAVPEDATPVKVIASPDESLLVVTTREGKLLVHCRGTNPSH